jgi:hypothetical protein
MGIGQIEPRRAAPRTAVTARPASLTRSFNARAVRNVADRHVSVAVTQRWLFAFAQRCALVTGVDVDPHMLAVGRARAAASGVAP